MSVEHIVMGRFVKAEHILTGLVELGSDRPVAQKPPDELWQTLRKEIERLEKSVSYPLSSSASREALLSRRVMLIQLNRLNEAADVLQPLMPNNTTDTTATLLLATIYRDSEQWTASDAAYEAALAKLLPVTATSEEARQSRRLSFDGLAYNGRMDPRPADAEHTLQRGLESLPSDTAYFHFQLGQYYANTGRPALAIEHLTRATELDSTTHREPARNSSSNCAPSHPSACCREIRMGQARAGERISCSEKCATREKEATYCDSPAPPRKVQFSLALPACRSK